MTNEYKPDWSLLERIEQMIHSYPNKYTEDFWQTIDPYFEKYQKFSILDIGCGPGLFLANLRKKYPQAQLSGLDEQKEMLEEVRNRDLEIKLHNFSVSNLKEIKDHKQRYDFLFLGFLFHELAEPLNTIRNLKEHLLKDAGYIVISDFIFAPIQDYLSYWKHISETKAIMRFPKPAKYSLEDIEYLLERAGFNIQTKRRIIPVAGTIVAKSI